MRPENKYSLMLSDMLNPTQRRHYPTYGSNRSPPRHAAWGFMGRMESHMSPFLEERVGQCARSCSAVSDHW